MRGSIPKGARRPYRPRASSKRTKASRESQIRPFSWRSFEYVRSDNFSQAVDFLKSLGDDMRGWLKDGLKPLEIMERIDPLLKRDMQPVRDVLAVINFRYGFSVTKRDFPELVLMRIILPEKMSPSSKRSYATSLRKVLTRGDKSIREVLAGGVHRARV